MASRWESLGLALRLRHAEITMIEKNRANVQGCLKDVLTKWLQKAYNITRFGDPSWNLLLEAVAHSAGGNDPALAEQIADRLKHRGKDVKISYIYKSVSAVT